MTDTLNYIKFKNFHSLRAPIKNIKRQATEWGRKYL